MYCTLWEELAFWRLHRASGQILKNGASYNIYSCSSCTEVPELRCFLETAMSRLASAINAHYSHRAQYIVHLIPINGHDGNLAGTS